MKPWQTWFNLWVSDANRGFTPHKTWLTLVFKMSWSSNWVVFPRLHFFCLLQAPWWTTRGGLWFLGCTTVWLLWPMRRRICMTTLNLTWTNTAKIVALRSYCTGPRQAAHFSWFLSNRIVFYKLLLLSCLCYLSRVVFFFFFPIAFRSKS